MAVDVERIILRLTADAVQYNRAMIAAENRLLAFAERSARASALITIPLAAAAGAVTGLGVAMGAAAYQAVSLASSWEQMNIALEVMTGSAETAKTLLQDISKLAVESPFKLVGLVASAKQLSAYGTRPEDIVPTLARLGDVAAGVSRGNLDEMMGRIILAYGQVRTAGRLRGSELRQFTEAGIPLPAELAKVFGIPKEQIQDFVQQGKVGFADVQRAFNNMTSEGGRFFNMMERQSKTVAGRWNAFVETLQLGAIKVGESFLRTFGINDLLDSWKKAIQGNDQEAIDRFFGGALRAVEDFWRGLKVGYAVVRGLALAIVEAVKAVTDWGWRNEKLIQDLMRVAVIIGLVIIAVKLLTLAVGILGFAFSGVGLVTAGVVSGVLLLTAALDELSEHGKFGESLSKGFQDLGKTFKGAWQGIKDAVDANDMDLAFKIIWESIKLGFRTMLLSLRVEWGRFVRVIGDTVSIDLMQNIEGAAIHVRYALTRLNPTTDDADEQRKRDERLTDTRLKFDRFRKQSQQEFERWSNEIMGRTQPQVEELRRLTQQARLAAREAEIRRNAPQIEELRQKLAAEFQRTFFEDLVTDGAFLTMLRMAGSGMLAGDGMVRGAMGFEFRELRHGLASPFPTQAQLEASPVYQMMLQLERLSGTTLFPMFANVAGGGHKGIPIGFGPGAQAINMARDVLEDFQKTGGLGPYDLLNRNVALLQEARFGPPALRALGGVVGGAGVAGGLAVEKLLEGMLNDPQYEFGLFKQYEDARKRIGQMPGGPPIAFRGSAEAQESINRAQTQIVDVQEQVRNTLIQLKEIQTQEKEYMRQVVEELKKQNAGGGGGGWFPGFDF